ncbi:MAG: COX15/CtaA family protein [Planctomycetota bacterium]
MVPRPAIVDPLIRSLASVTCIVALLPIGMGALVTTLKAGMAFADWPSSDGQNMLLYPWFRDFFDHPDKFVEHGHRLAGVLIGLVSICLAIAGWVAGSKTTRIFVTAILISVIAQGLLGGARVLMDRQIMAMIHSITGASFFALCIVFRLLCSDRRMQWSNIADTKLTPFSAAVVACLPVVVIGQYVLGGMLRHLHLMLNEHIVGAIVTGFAACSAIVVLLRTDHPLLKLCGLLISASLFAQISLGIGAYITRFGLASVGYVATAGSVAQSIVCSLHTVVGMFLLSSSVVSTVSLAMLYRAGMLKGLNVEFMPLADRGSAV